MANHLKHAPGLNRGQFGCCILQTSWNSQENVNCVWCHMFLPKNVYKWAKLFKEGRRSVGDETGMEGLQKWGPCSDRISQWPHSVWQKGDSGWQCKEFELICWDSTQNCQWWPWLLKGQLPVGAKDAYSRTQVEEGRVVLAVSHCHYEKDGDGFLKKMVTCD